jgi:hypothetical protein
MGSANLIASLLRADENRGEETADPSTTLRSGRDDKFIEPFTTVRRTGCSDHSLQQICHPDRTRISCHATLDIAACAAFVKESSIKCTNATKLHRKSGGAQRSGGICGFFSVRPQSKSFISPAPTPQSPSVMKLRSELNLSWSLRSRHKAKARCPKNRCIVRVLWSRGGKQKIGMIQGVEGLGTKFKL